MAKEKPSSEKQQNNSIFSRVFGSNNSNAKKPNDDSTKENKETSNNTQNSNSGQEKMNTTESNKAVSIEDIFNYRVEAKKSLNDYLANNKPKASSYQAMQQFMEGKFNKMKKEADEKIAKITEESEQLKETNDNLKTQVDDLNKNLTSCQNSSTNCNKYLEEAREENTLLKDMSKNNTIIVESYNEVQQSYNILVAQHNTTQYTLDQQSIHINQLEQFNTIHDYINHNLPIVSSFSQCFEGTAIQSVTNMFSEGEEPTSLWGDLFIGARSLVGYMVKATGNEKWLQDNFADAYDDISGKFIDPAHKCVMAIDLHEEYKGCSNEDYSLKNPMKSDLLMKACIAYNTKVDEYGLPDDSFCSQEVFNVTHDFLCNI